MTSRSPTRVLIFFTVGLCGLLHGCSGANSNAQSPVPSTHSQTSTQAHPVSSGAIITPMPMATYQPICTPWKDKAVQISWLGSDRMNYVLIFYDQVQLPNGQKQKFELGVEKKGSGHFSSFSFQPNPLISGASAQAMSHPPIYTVLDPATLTLSSEQDLLHGEISSGARVWAFDTQVPIDAPQPQCQKMTLSK